MSAAVAEQAARAAGRIIQQAAGSGLTAPVLSANKKGAVDLVTQVDLASEAAIREVLARLSPGVPVLAEEGGGAAGVRTRWIVDPLDGTTNFVHGFPSYAVSIALEVEGVLEAACVYDPLRDQAYTADRGRGAWCGSHRLQVSAREHLDDALLLTGFAYDRRERAAFYLRFVKAFLERGQGLRRAGAAALDLVHIAAGRADGYWEFGLSPWDVAAGALLVQEAGGQVSDVALGPLSLDKPRILATNGRIHAEMAAVIGGLLEG